MQRNLSRMVLWMCPTRSGLHVYKVAHVPQNANPYEFFGCASWTSEVDVSILYVMGNHRTQKNIRIRPYEANNDITDTTMKVISITTPQDPLMNHTFTKSTQFTVIVPEHYTTAVQCTSNSQARDKFSTCSTEEICLCSNNGIDVDCECPSSSLATLHQNYETTLPITTPNLHLYEKNSTLVAEMDQIEMTVAIKSRYVVKQSILIRNPTCAVQLSPVQGCYKCLEGAKVTALCTTATPSLVEVHCTGRTFVIQCGPKRTEQTLKFHFNSAIIFERCTTSCGNRNLSLIVEGILRFHSENDRELRKLEITHQWHTSDGLPDLSPLLITLKNHWKIALILAISTIALTIGTYLWGPLTIFILINTIFLVVKNCIFTVVKCI